MKQNLGLKHLIFIGHSAQSSIKALTFLYLYVILNLVSEHSYIILNERSDKA